MKEVVVSFGYFNSKFLSEDYGSASFTDFRENYLSADGLRDLPITYRYALDEIPANTFDVFIPEEDRDEIFGAEVYVSFLLAVPLNPTKNKEEIGVAFEFNGAANSLIDGAFWIEEGKEEEALDAGYIVLDYICVAHLYLLELLRLRKEEKGA